MSRPSVLIAGGACALSLIVVVSRHWRRPDSADSTRSTVQGAPSLPQRGVEGKGWIARPDAPGPLSAGGAAVERGGGAGLAGGTGSRPDIEGSAGGAATVVRGGRLGQGGGGAIGPGTFGSRAEPGSIHAATGLPVEANTIPGTESRALRTAGGNAETDPHAVTGQPLVEVQDKPKAAQPDPEGVVLQLSFDKTTVPEKGDTSPVVEQNVTLDSGTGAHFSADSQFVIPDAGNLKGDAGTISFTLQPEWGGDDKDLASLLQLRTNDWANRLQIFKDGSYLRFLFTPNTGVEANPAVDISNWEAGQSYQVTTTWGATPAGDRFASLYVNGQLVAQQPYDGQLEIPPGTPLYIGSDHQGGQPGARGVMSDLKIYDTVRAP